jgi:hypothetical protein
MDLGILARAAVIEDSMGASGTFRQSGSHVVHLGDAIFLVTTHFFQLSC